jgi:hypothetical protein
LLWHKVNTKRNQNETTRVKKYSKTRMGYLTIIGTMTRKLLDLSIEKVKAFQEGLIVQIKYPCGHAFSPSQ